MLLGLSLFGQSAVPANPTSCTAVLGTVNIDVMGEVLDGGTASGMECFAVNSADAAGIILVRVRESFGFSNCDEGWFKLQ